VNIIFRGRHTDVLDRFRKHATAKISKIAKLDSKTISVDVEVCAEHNPRQSQQRERVELTIWSRGPVIRAEAGAEDRYAALDLALSKLESRLRRACDRRKDRHGSHGAVRVIDLPVADGPQPGQTAVRPGPLPEEPLEAARRETGSVQDNGQVTDDGADDLGIPDDVVPIQMEGDGPCVVRAKYHVATPMSIEQALFEMELVGHDFFLFRDTEDGRASVVYRRRGYQYGVIRLVEAAAEDGTAAVAGTDAASRANGRPKRAEPLNAR
jgi:ribosomal subunit interface protein